MKRIALISASLVLVGGMASACGNSPEDADKDEFCKAADNFFASENEDDFNDNKDELKDVGTPEEIDGDAREGFEFVVDLDWDDREDEPSDDDMEKATAFFEKYGELCGGGDVPETDLEETPTDGVDGMETE